MVEFEVRESSHGPVIEVTSRDTRQMAGWQWVRYNGRRYQLFGGIRGPYFIDLSNPIRSRETKKVPVHGGAWSAVTELPSELEYGGAKPRRSSKTRHHATKKSPVQLQREIDEALATPLVRHGDRWISQKEAAARGAFDPNLYEKAVAEGRVSPAVATRIAKASRRPSGNGGRTHSTKKSSTGPSSSWTVIGLYDNGQRAAYVVRSPNAALAEQQALSQADSGFDVAGVVKGSVQLHDADSGVAAAKRDDGHKPRMCSWTVLGLYDNGQRAAYVVRSPNAVFAEPLALSQADTGFEVAGVLKGSVRLAA